MSDLHELCYFEERPVTRDIYLSPLKHYLKSGIPATYTLEDVANYEKNIENAEVTSATTPLHLICSNIPKDVSESERNVVLEMIDELLFWGAGWCLTDRNNQTPGCILVSRGLKDSEFYSKIVDAGVRAEILLRKIEDASDFEFVEDKTDELVKENEPAESEIIENRKNIKILKTNEDLIEDDKADPSYNQEAFLKSKLEYKDNSLLTKEGNDGVMMRWEENLMQAGCDSLFQNYQEDETKEINVLNIGYGMGIIDSIIEKKGKSLPKGFKFTHFICEAHPDVLKEIENRKLDQISNIKILKGRWQTELPKLLSQNVFFNGIYYDTYSEHYEDMLELFDLIVGLLKPEGNFSFFNGLGADREVCYDVYKKVVELDLNNYGLEIKFDTIKIPEETLKFLNDKSSDNKIRKSYWSCSFYYHPTVTFMLY
ncbi:protein-arginine N5-methyltransferase [Ascoidea rubescens DSM 1968]|uniref:Arginine N-methyltransferase 2 n=1 Tax=Ascoidea rubescens DSM 1968 TaxID=1344418 RepID=A0A1D2VL60_9ASCO|nr:arginine N-methyltransferase 2 [Ascoidea rubescens DSM 1968]ODV62332.1 arginine N-methyltransferase 2 [Ascoidea rubescens DSM 1968]